MAGGRLTTKQIGFIGIIRATVRNTDGSVFSERDYYNTDTYFMRSAVAGWLAGTKTTTNTPPPTQIGAGNGIGTPSPSDTALWSPISGTLRTCDSIQISQGYYAQFNITYQTTDPSGAYTEVGLFDAAGNMWAHASINEIKAANQTLTIQWMILSTADTSNTSAVVTNYALQTITGWLAGTLTTTSAPPPTQIQLGTGSGVVQVTDTALWTPVAGTLATCSAIYISASYNVQWMATYNGSYPQNTYTEAGLVDAGGNLWLHATLPSGSSNQNNRILSLLLQISVSGD